MIPRPGDTLHIGPEASVQFAHGCHFNFRVIKIETSPSAPDGWVHLTGYQLYESGNAECRRTIFVQCAGLRIAYPTPPLTAARRPVNAGPARIPQQRTRTNPTARSHR